MVSLIITLVNSIYLKDIFEKGAMKIKTTKRSIILLISSTETIKLKSFIKFHNQLVIPLSWSLGPTSPENQWEPQLHPYEIMK